MEELKDFINKRTQEQLEQDLIKYEAEKNEAYRTLRGLDLLCTMSKERINYYKALNIVKESNK